MNAVLALTAECSLQMNRLARRQVRSSSIRVVGAESGTLPGQSYGWLSDEWLRQHRRCYEQL